MEGSLAEIAEACRSFVSGVNIGTDYDAEELAFLKAVDAYKRHYQRPYPTCREVLAVLKSLGYRKAE